MDAATILSTLDDIGVSVELNGDRLSMKPKSRIPPDLADKVKERKQELILHLSQSTSTPSIEVIQYLNRAIERKQEDLKIRRRQLADPKCPNPEFCIDQITSMEGHIVEINRYLKEGGDLAIPRCCLQHENYCFLNHAMAMKGFDGCLLSPDGCGFGLRL